MNRDALIETLAAMRRSFGVSAEEFVRLARQAAELEGMPTIAEFYEQHVVPAEQHKAAWDKRKGLHAAFVEEFGDRRLDEVSSHDIGRYAARRQQQARTRSRRGRALTGAGAQRNVVEAAAAFFRVAIDLEGMSTNPAHRVTKAPRGSADPRSLTEAEVQQLWSATIGAGDDPELDGLLVWFHLETGARRGGALGLRVGDIDDHSGCVRLVEKGDRERFQSVSALLLDALRAHVGQRGRGRVENPVFHYRRSQPTHPFPLTKKRYELLLNRLNEELGWARGIRIHDLRHTAITPIEHIAGTAVARRFAGHASRSMTDRYSAAAQDEMEAAVARYHRANND